MAVAEATAGAADMAEAEAADEGAATAAEACGRMPTVAAAVGAAGVGSGPAELAAARKKSSESWQARRGGEPVDGCRV